MMLVFLLILTVYVQTVCLVSGAAVKNLPANAGDARDAASIPGSGRPPGEGNGNPLQASCLENSPDRGICRATAHEAAKSRMQLSMHAHHTQAQTETVCVHVGVQR